MSAFSFKFLIVPLVWDEIFLQTQSNETRSLSKENWERFHNSLDLHGTLIEHDQHWVWHGIFHWAKPSILDFTLAAWCFRISVPLARKKKCSTQLLENRNLSDQKPMQWLKPIQLLLFQDWCKLYRFISQCSSYNSKMKPIQIVLIRIVLQRLKPMQCLKPKLFLLLSQLIALKPIRLDAPNEKFPAILLSPADLEANSTLKPYQINN